MLKAFFLGGAMAATFILLFSFMGIFGSMVSVLTPYKCAAPTAACGFAIISLLPNFIVLCWSCGTLIKSGSCLPGIRLIVSGCPQSVGLDIREVCGWAAQCRLQIFWWEPPLTNAHTSIAFGGYVPVQVARMQPKLHYWPPRMM